MSLIFRERQRQRRSETVTREPDLGGSPAAPDPQNILVSSGIHRGRFPVGGMTVREARQVLAPMMNIDPDAMAVINGRPVDEDMVLNGTLGMLSFVKPSSLKG